MAAFLHRVNALPPSSKILLAISTCAVLTGAFFGLHSGVDLALVMIGVLLPLAFPQNPVLSLSNPRWLRFWTALACISLLEALPLMAWRESGLFAAVKLTSLLLVYRSGVAGNVIKGFASQATQASTRIQPLSDSPRPREVPPLSTGFFGYYCNELDRVQRYIASGADLNEEVIASGTGIAWDNSQWKPPLHWAALLQSRTCVQALLEAGADPYVRDRKFGLTALEVARAEDASPEFLLIFVSYMRRLSKATSQDGAGIPQTLKGGDNSS